MIKHIFVSNEQQRVEFQSESRRFLAHLAQRLRSFTFGDIFWFCFIRVIFPVMHLCPWCWRWCLNLAICFSGGDINMSALVMINRHLVCRYKSLCKTEVSRSSRGETLSMKPFSPPPTLAHNRTASPSSPTSAKYPKISSSIWTLLPSSSAAKTTPSTQVPPNASKRKKITMTKCGQILENTFEVPPSRR